MRLLDLTLDTPARNLALDEALLDPSEPETLRFWESPTPVVVLGRSSRAAEEADLRACRAAGAPILRRASGGAAVVATRGCLMYALTFDLDARPALRAIDHAHAWVLGRIAEALRAIEPTVAVAGISDLAFTRGPGAALKFSGNSVRRVRSRLLYHGTLLYDADLAMIDSLLCAAPRQPEYRAARSHREFIGNLGCTADALRAALVRSWGARPSDPYGDALVAVRRLVEDKYSLDSWNLAR